MISKTRNFRGIFSADIEPKPLTGVFGKNGNGKSSIAQAMGCALTGNTSPVKGLLKKQTKQLVREGAKTGGIQIDGPPADDGTPIYKVGVIWPECLYKNEGNPPKNISTFAAGMESIIDLDRKNRPAPLSDYIDSKPTEADLKKVLKAENFNAELIDKIAESVKINGYDTSHAKTGEKGTLLKGQWQEVTGEEYGSRKAENWQHAGWIPGMEKQDIYAFANNVAVCDNEVATGTAAKVLSEMEKAELEKSAASKSQSEVMIVEYEKRINFAVEEYEGLKVKLKPIDEGKEQGCPGCGLALTVVDGIIQESKKDDAANAAAIKSNAEIQEKIKTCLDRTDKLRAELRAEETVLLQATNAETRLKDNAKADGKKWTKNLEEWQTKRDAAVLKRDAFKATTRAQELNTGIQSNKAIQDILAPAGIRKTKLLEALQPFNKMLAELSELAGWPEVRLDNNYDITFGHRLVNLCSKSEQYKAKAIMQITMAKIENAVLTIIDEADIIVGKVGKNQFLTLLNGSGIDVIFFMSVPGKEDAPDLSKIGGATYWVEKGETECLNS